MLYYVSSKVISKVLGSNPKETTLNKKKRVKQFKSLTQNKLNAVVLPSKLLVNLNNLIL